MRKVQDIVDAWEKYHATRDGYYRPQSGPLTLVPEDLPELTPEVCLQRLAVLTDGRISTPDDVRQFDAALFTYVDNSPLTNAKLSDVCYPALVTQLCEMGYFEEEDSLLAVKWLQYYLSIVQEKPQPLDYEG